MPKIISPYAASDTTGIGDTLTGLAETLFGPKASQAALYREKFKEAQRQNEFLPQYAGAMGAGADPGEIARLAIMAGQAGQDVGNYGRYVTVNRNPNALESGVVTSSILGAGGGMAATPAGFAQEQATKLRGQEIASNRAFDAAIATANNTPEAVIDPDDPFKIKYVSRAEAIAKGMRPVPTATQAEGVIRLGGMPTGYAGFNPQQQVAAGVATKDEKGQNFRVLDALGNPVDQGVTLDSGATRRDGTPIVPPPGHTLQLLSTVNPNVGQPSPTKGVDEIRSGRIATATANDIINRLDQGLQQPNANAALGLVGWGATAINQLRSQADAIGGVAGQLGYEGVAGLFNQGAANLVGSDARIAGLAQQLNIDRSVLTSQISSLAYAIAKANNPSGQIGVRDVNDAMATIGATIHDPVAFRAVLQDLKTRMNEHQRLRESVILPTLAPDVQRLFGAGASTATPAPTTAAPTAAPVQGTTSTGVPYQLTR